MKKRIIAFVAGTAAVMALAIGWQAFGTTSSEESKDLRPPATSTETPAADPSDGSGTTDAPSETPTDGATEAKSDDGERDGFTEDNTGKPGENKD